MKALITSTLIAFATLGTVAAQAAGDHAGHSMASQAVAASEKQMVDGQVKKVDKAAGKLTLAHGPLVNLGMPAMTMLFRVKDAGWLDQMKAGDKIRFMADNVNGAVTIVHFEPAR
ncbi:MAG: RND transporter [Betaproteobacteria bacterium HGW-Betaproteobacteria-12]|nr:MAG: RND transporter [Betaproteobacteria bacterium HGW-Betaproteobacteria-12]